MMNEYAGLLDVTLGGIILVFVWFVLWRHFAIEILRNKLRRSLAAFRREYELMDGADAEASASAFASMESYYITGIRRAPELGQWRSEMRRLLLRLFGVNRCFTCMRVEIARVQSDPAQQVLLVAYRDFSRSMVTFYCMTSIGFLIRYAVDFVRFVIRSIRDLDTHAAVLRAQSEAEEKRILEVDRATGCHLTPA